MERLAPTCCLPAAALMQAPLAHMISLVRTPAPRSVGRSLVAEARSDIGHSDSKSSIVSNGADLFN